MPIKEAYKINLIKFKLAFRYIPKVYLFLIDKNSISNEKYIAQNRRQAF